MVAACAVIDAGLVVAGMFVVAMIVAPILGI
jgi:hypothetical protein